MAILSGESYCVVLISTEIMVLWLSYCLNLIPENRRVFRVNCLQKDQWIPRIFFTINLIQERLVSNFVAWPIIFAQVVKSNKLSKCLGVDEDWFNISLCVANGLHDQETQHHDNDSPGGIVTQGL